MTRDVATELSWQPSEERPIAGARVEDDRLLRGAGRFLDDLVFARQAFAWMVRSPHAHARIGAIDAARAAAARGVLRVLTGNDAELRALGTFPCEVKMTSRDGTPLIIPPRRAMAQDRARFAGEIVAMVVAESLDAARDAAELIAIDYVPLPAASDAAAALAPGATQIWDEAPGNLCFDWETGDAAATDSAIRSAAHVVRLSLRNNRICPCPLEARGAIGIHDAARDTYLLHSSTQGSAYVRNLLAEPVLRVPRERLRVATPDVGGAFGLKLFPYPEQALVLVAARALGRPVRWIADRSESFLADNAARDQVNEAELALDAEGRFLALRVRSLANMGAGLSANAPHVPTTGSVKTLTGVYAIPIAHMHVRGAITNTAPVEAYRGAGRPESIYVIERLVDRAARVLGIDRIELRRRNLVPVASLPYRVTSGQSYRSVDFRRPLDEAVRRADLAGFARRRAASEAAGRRRGIGISCHLHTTSGMPGERATIDVDPSRGIVVHSASHSAGQGHESVFPVVVGELLGVHPALVAFRQGDPDHQAECGGTGGSGSMIVTTTALTRAAGEVVREGRKRAAEHLELPQSLIEFADGRFRARARNLSFDVLELARLTRAPIRGAGVFSPEGPSFPNGCHVCEIEIDPESGAARIMRFTVVQDVGRVAAPAMVEAQLHGGIVQGIGQALSEDCAYDRATGQLVAASLMDYTLPRAADMPFIDIVLAGQPCASNPSGMKGMGEIGAIGAPPAVINAIADALGRDDVQMPATSARIWEILRA
jgi:carbon-monoxide dehydrogenase large subunit